MVSNDCKLEFHVYGADYPDAVVVLFSCPRVANRNNLATHVQSVVSISTDPNVGHMQSVTDRWLG